MKGKTHAIHDKENKNKCVMKYYNKNDLTDIKKHRQNTTVKGMQTPTAHCVPSRLSVTAGEIKNTELNVEKIEKQLSNFRRSDGKVFF